MITSIEHQELAAWKDFTAFVWGTDHHECQPGEPAGHVEKLFATAHEAVAWINSLNPDDFVQAHLNIHSHPLVPSVPCNVTGRHALDFNGERIPGVVAFSRLGNRRYPPPKLLPGQKILSYDGIGTPAVTGPYSYDSEE